MLSHRLNRRLINGTNTGRSSGRNSQLDRRSHVACAAAFVLGALAIESAWAANVAWACEQGSFENSRCWSPLGVPGAGDDVRVNGLPSTGGGLGANVYFTSISGNRSLRSLTIDEAGNSGASANFWQEGGTLASGWLRIGPSGGGAYVQYGGTHRASSIDMLGRSRTGKYQLSGGALEVDSLVQIGGGEAAAPNYFVQYGGTAVLPKLNVGVGGSGFGGKGSYSMIETPGLSAPQLTTQTLVLGSNYEGRFSLSGSDASVVVSTSLFVGQQAPGQFAMSTGNLSAASATVGDWSSGRLMLDGGQQDFTSLVLGAQASGIGVWQVDSGRAEVRNLWVGSGGVGEVLHSGGTVAVGSSLSIAENSRYVLSGQVATTVLQGPLVGAMVNRGSFEQSGGSFTGYLLNEGVYLAEHAQAGQTIVGGRLINRGTAVLLSNTRFSGGLTNEATMNVLAVGRTLTLDGLGFDNSGSFVMNGGTLQGAGSFQRNSGSFSGHGRISGAGAAFTNSGSLVQQGGTLVLSNSRGAVNTGLWQLATLKELQLDGSGVVLDNHGRLELNDGRVTGSGRLSNGSAGIITGSGSIGAAFTNLGTVSVASGQRLAVTGSFAQAGVLALDGSSASLSGAKLINTGLVLGQGRIANAIDNAETGRVQAQGGVLTLAGAVTNTGTLVAGSGGTLLVPGALTQQGRVQLEGGSLDTGSQPLLNQGVLGGFGTLRTGGIDNQGQMLFSAGAAQLHGNLRNRGAIVVTGGGVANFHGNLRAEAGSELRVSEASAAVFFDSVSLATGAALTGSGTFYFEGGISVGDSPGAASVDGDVVFGARSLYRAEIGGFNGGVGHDLFTAGGRLSFGGTLQLSWLGGFQARDGDSFDLFDWASAGGRFSAIDSAAAPLPDGLRWDTSRLHVDGTVSIAAVPEPATWGLMGAGLLVLLVCRRRVIRGR